MRHEAKVTAIVVATLMLTGCTRSTMTSNIRPDSMSVSVRFVLPSEQDRYSSLEDQTQTKLAADSTYRGFSGHDPGDGMTTWKPSAYHVALWGGNHNGTDVTTEAMMLPPGSYTFAFFDQPKQAVMQGWLDIRNTKSDLASVLSKWKDSIDEQKKRLAFDLEVDGRMTLSDPEVFNEFEKQMKACDRLNRSIDAAIKMEYRAQKTKKKNIVDLLHDAELVIMPGEDTFFHPTTQPAFNEDDVAAVHAGNAVTKMILAADYKEAKWKLGRINQLYGDIARFKEVMEQEADRLERRKGLFLLTDHLYNHDKRFVENEMQLQYTLGLIERFDEHASDLREHRMALAFVTSLFTPHANFNALDQEQRDLVGERTVLETQRRRLDRTIDATEENDVKRVTLERNRQRVIAMLDDIEAQMEGVGQARTALASMADATDVIHRHNDTRLMTATFVEKEMPPAVLRIVERQAMMTARLEPTDKVFVPRPMPMTPKKVAHVPARSEDWTYHQPSQVMDYSTYDNVEHAQTQNQVVEHAVEQSPPTYVNDETVERRTVRTVKEDVHRYAAKDHVKVHETQDGHGHQNTADHHRPRQAKLTQHTSEPSAWQKSKKTNYQNDTDESCHWLVRMLVPPCWMADMAKTKTKPAAKLARHSAKGAIETDSECHWLAKIFVPPCWDDDGWDAKSRQTKEHGQSRPRTAKLTSHPDPSNKWQADEPKDDCHWLVRILVPPCWMANRNDPASN